MKKLSYKLKNEPLDIDYQILQAILKAEKELNYSEIKKKCKITDPTLSKHLKKLCAGDYLLRNENKKSNEYPHPVFYKIHEDIKTFERLATRFIGTSKELIFHSSAYCQSILNMEFVEKIKKNWHYPNDEFIRNKYLNAIFFEDENGTICELPAMFNYQIDGSNQSTAGKKIIDINIEKRLEMANEHIKGFSNRLFGNSQYISDEELLFILKSSPTALKFALNIETILSDFDKYGMLSMSYSFLWDDVPGDRENELIKFLENEDLGWEKKPKFEKSNDGKEIIIYDEKNSISFKLNKQNKKAYINSNIKSHEFDVIYEKLNEEKCIRVIGNSVPRSIKEKFVSQNWFKIHEIFIEQILLNFVSDIQLSKFFALTPFSVNLEVNLDIRMSLNGKQEIYKGIGTKMDWCKK